MTTTKVLEDAQSGDIPADEHHAAASPLPRMGRILVIPANGRSLSLEDANAALEAVRNGEDDD